MGVYVKGYKQRAMAIITTIAIVVMSSLLCYGLFNKKLEKTSGQLNSYVSADYSIIYLLNYGDGLNNECLFPDTDIQFFTDSSKTKRLTVSSVMRQDGVSYDLRYLEPLSTLNANEICISQNTAKLYGLSIGDIVFAEYPYKSELVPTKVIAIAGTEFDYENPFVDNDIGVIFIGYDERYSASTNGKYILFAASSRAEELSVYPQIINTVISKAANEDTVSAQGFTALLFETLFTIVTIILVQMVFFSKSNLLLYRCYLKGMRRSLMTLIPFLERIVFCLVPCIATQLIITNSLLSSSITTAYRITPSFICAVYCVVMLIRDSLKLRKRGC